MAICGLLKKSNKSLYCASEAVILFLEKWAQRVRKENHYNMDSVGQLDKAFFIIDLAIPAREPHKA
jgi:hypothetical protein